MAEMIYLVKYDENGQFEGWARASNWKGAEAFGKLGYSPRSRDVYRAAVQYLESRDGEGEQSGTSDVNRTIGT
jgi:hypothetical protein